MRMPLNRYVQTPPAPKPVDYRSELLAAIDDLPPLPLVLDRVLQLLRDSNASTAQIAAMIEMDAVLSGSVLRCVNSAYYGLRSTVTSIRHAVSLLGFASVRNLTMAFSLRRALAAGSRLPPPQLYSRYSQHSLSSAVLCQFLVQHAAVENPDAAFAVGLFHDIGKLLILTAFPDVGAKITERLNRGDCTYVEAELELVEIAHAEASRMVLEKWQLPTLIQEAVEYHHRPAECPSAEGGKLTLAHLVHAADLYVNECGLQILPLKVPNAYPAQRAFEDIGLRQTMPEVLEKFQKEYEGIRTLF